MLCTTAKIFLPLTMFQVFNRCLEKLFVIQLCRHEYKSLIIANWQITQVIMQQYFLQIRQLSKITKYWTTFLWRQIVLFVSCPLLHSEIYVYTSLLYRALSLIYRLILTLIQSKWCIQSLKWMYIQWQKRNDVIHEENLK